MSLWRKHAIGYWSHPKVLAAGWKAAVVFCAVLDLNADLARDGQLLARDARPEALLAYATILGPRAIRDGLAKCVEVELLARTEDGGIRIVGWGDEWRPLRADPIEDAPATEGAATCSRCHARPPEPGLRRCAECLDYDAARRSSAESAIARATRSAKSAMRNAKSAVRSAVAPQRAAQSLNGYRSGMLLSEEERREDQSRQELVNECLNECSPSRVLGEDQKASGTQDTGAREGAESARIQRVVDTLSARFCAGEGR